MKFPHLTCTFPLLVVPLVLAGSYVKPESDGRSYFAVLMSNILDLHSKVKGKELSFTISPAAVQKTLAILYNSVEDNKDLLDLMLMEMGLKYFDAMRLMETAIQEMTSFDTLKEDRFEKLDKPIKRTDVLQYFQRDFNELGSDIFYNTILATPSRLQISNDFNKFAKEFFNSSVLHGNHENSINIYNEIVYTTKWKPNFIEATDHLSTRGQFRYGEIANSENGHESVRILEVPVESNVALSVLFIMPKYASDLAWSTNYEVIRPLTDTERIDDILKEHMVEVRLPKTFNFETHADLIDDLRKCSITRAKIYEAPQTFNRIFNNPPKNGISLGKFWQNIMLKIEAKIVNELPVNHNGFLSTIKQKFVDLTQTETFDITEKPFLFMFKSKEIIYFMGYFYGNIES